MCVFVFVFVFVFVSHLVADDGELARLEGVNDDLGVPAQLAAVPERVLKHSRVGRHLIKMAVSTSAVTVHGWIYPSYC